jgi:LysR family nitrogen assimilation transcriptional regulator
MELRELRNFMRVARAGSVSRAAEELRLAQPALSRQISKLERELGVSLFARHGRGAKRSGKTARCPADASRSAYRPRRGGS